MLLLHNFTTFGLHFLCVHPVLCPSSARSDQHSVGLCVVLQDGARDSHRDAQTFADLPTEKNYFVRHGECETQTLMLLGTTCLCLLCLCLCLCTFQRFPCRRCRRRSRSLVMILKNHCEPRLLYSGKRKRNLNQHISKYIGF